jgi:hypothetical protein
LHKIFNSVIDLNISFSQVNFLDINLLNLSEGAFTKKSLKLLDFHWVDMVVLRLLILFKVTAISENAIKTEPITIIFFELGYFIRCHFYYN